MATAPQNTTTELVHHLGPKPLPAEQTALAVATPVELLRIAVSQNANIDQLTKLMDLQERWEKREAKRAYDAAMKAFKADCPRITKNSQVDFTTTKGRTNYKHATLDHVCDSIIGALSKHGITHRWKVSQANEWITVTCVLTHELGHSEETSLMGTPDQTGNKNSIQAVGSTVTYLQRYTLLAATGLATSDSDDDGRGGAAAAGIPQDRIEEMSGEIRRASNLEQLRKIFAFAYREAESAKDRPAMATYIRVKDARKRELQ